MRRPFELSKAELADRLEEMVDATMGDLVSEFLLLPKGENFIGYEEFREAYETLKRHTNGFVKIGRRQIIEAMRNNSRCLLVVRTILGMTAPEWAEIARSEMGSDITQGAARQLDKKCRESISYFHDAEERYSKRKKKVPGLDAQKNLGGISALIEVAVMFLKKGAPEERPGMVHRLAKFDTQDGLESISYAGRQNVPYAVLLYERYLGRPFASHRDAVSELVGEVMENAVESRLINAGVTYRKTKRAERIPGFGQAPDFCVPDEINPAVVIEAKITSDDGTARDKVARIKVLAEQRDARVTKGKPPYEVVACIDGRGFRERREDMRQMLTRLNGKVFTTATLDQLIPCTGINRFATRR